MPVSTIDGNNGWGIELHIVSHLNLVVFREPRQTLHGPYPRRLSREFPVKPQNHVIFRAAVFVVADYSGCRGSHLRRATDYLAPAAVSLAFTAARAQS